MQVRNKITAVKKTQNIPDKKMQKAKKFGLDTLYKGRKVHV